MILNRFLKKGDVYIPEYAHQYVTVFSHPRSGTHFLEAFLGENFYSDHDMSVRNVEWGHWANRKVLEEGNKYGKLFGSHLFPQKQYQKTDFPIVYIYRDVRAVSLSIWKTDNFIHPKYSGISFSDFLRLKIDWIGSPAFKCRQKMTIGQHWEKHVKGWFKMAKKNPNILMLKYEDLMEHPYSAYRQIHDVFFPERQLKNENEINIIKSKVGLLPNEAKINSWESVLSEKDISLLSSHYESIYRK